MIFKFQGIAVFYKISGSRARPVNIFLHGWGQSGECFAGAISACEGFCNISVDFPPFGKSEEPKDWTIFTYADMLISLCEALKIKKCNIIGHSFGGRVAILAASKKSELVNNLILVGSAGMKPKRKFRYYIRVFKYKLSKFFGRKSKNSGSKDYNALSDNMKKTFVSIVSTHLERYCRDISAPTLIVFGENDTETPIYMAKRLKKLIKNSSLHILPHAGHFCFQERQMQFNRLLTDFLTKEKIL